MKNLLITLVLLISTSSAQSQFIQSLNILPQNPTSNDTLRIIAEGYLPNSGCNDKTITTSLIGTQLNVTALHCMGLLTTICNVNDTILIPPMAAGSYTLNFSLAGGFLPAPCTPFGPTATSTLNFTVSPGVQTANSNALAFDNIDDFVEAPNASALIAGSNNISMSMWVYPENSALSYPDFDGFGGFRDEFSADFYLLQLNSTNVEARFRNSTGTPYTMVFTGLQMNTWQHFVLTYDGSTLALYHNGILAISTAANGNINATNNPFFVGKAPFTNAPFLMKGKLDEVSLWSKTLSQQEIDCIYSSGINPTSANLQLYYKCNQGIAGGNNTSITNLNDASGHINGLFNSMSLTGSISNFVQGVTTSSTTINAVLCPGTTYTFGGQSISAPGTYFETFTGASGCDSIVQLILTSPTFNTAVSQSGPTLIAQQPTGPYQWINCATGSPIPGAVNQFFTATANGQYAVVLSQGGCTDTSLCLTVTGINTGLNESFTSLLMASPVPFGDQLTLLLPVGLNTVINIMDVSGRSIVNELNLIGGERYSIDSREWPQGIYMIRAVDGSIRMKVMKQ
jgi:hypothetical protein